MNYLLSFLTLLGCVVGIIIVAGLFAIICVKLEDLERHLDLKYEKYRKFKNNVLPWIVVAIIVLMFLFCLVTGYMEILKRFSADG